MQTAVRVCKVTPGSSARLSAKFLIPVRLVPEKAEVNILAALEPLVGL